MVLQETYKLYNGIEIPKLGLGTWQTPDGEAAYNSVRWALEAGYRHIDTAMAYGNEESVGKAIKDSGVKREDIFVTTKLPAEKKGYDIAKASFEKSLADLGLSYIDLYLIHAPWPWDQIGKDCTQGNIDSYKAMEEIYAAGKAKAIGVSNFEKKHLEPILKECDVIPMVNQICFHVGNVQEETMAFCKELNIQIMAYSPLGTGSMLQKEGICNMAAKYGVTPAQLCIRFCLQKGTVAIPKSTKKERIIDNKNVEFVISKEDMKILETITN